MIEGRSGMDNHVFVIAEAGVNHNGSLRLAKEMVDEAKKAGADAIKFQTFKAEKLVSDTAPKAEYQKKLTGEQESQLDMLKKLELSFEEFSELSDYCHRQKIMFLSTPFDQESLTFLDTVIKIPLIKIPSGEITNRPLLEQIRECHKPVILSTGMCTLEEIQEALDVLGDEIKISILHCTTDYPAAFDTLNLRVIPALREKFQKEIGYSDHSKGIEASIAAVALGARIIEKHFTLDRKMKGPDHKASLEPSELQKMTGAIRNVEMALGNGIKHPMEKEMENAKVARKSIVASTRIFKGEVFDEKNLSVKRPGTGISPMRWHDVIGQMAKRDFEKDEMIEL